MCIRDRNNDMQSPRQVTINLKKKAVDPRSAFRFDRMLNRDVDYVISVVTYRLSIHSHDAKLNY